MIKRFKKWIMNILCYPYTDEYYEKLTAFEEQEYQKRISNMCEVLAETYGDRYIYKSKKSDSEIRFRNLCSQESKTENLRACEKSHEEEMKK